MAARGAFGFALLVLAAGPAFGRTAREEGSRVAPEHVVTIHMDAPYFRPARLTIHVGDTVRWVSPSASDIHDVRELSDAIVFDGKIAPGGSWSFPFDAPGEYDYGCRYHPWMRGHISVRPAR